MMLVLLTLIINTIEPNIEFPNETFNRFWGFLICFFCLISFLIVIMVFKSFNKIAKWIVMLIGFPTALTAIFYILIMNAEIAYEPRFEKYVAYRNLNKSNQYILVQDYIKWKPNLPSVDTTLIDDYYILRKFKRLDSMDLKGTWIKFDDQGKTNDTIKIQ